MKIDRARFLVLTGAISGVIAAACAIQACTVATTSTPDAGGSGSDSGTGQDATNGTDSGGGTDSGTTGTDADAGSDSPTACDDSVGNAGACADYLDGGTPADAGNGCLIDILCGNLLGALKPKVAENAISCIATGPACEGAAGTPIADCVAQALGNACTDPTGQASCDQIAATCADGGADAGISSTDCQKLTAGMTSDGRAKFVACMTESACFVTDPKDCLEFP
jgi:hypothetical protein